MSDAEDPYRQGRSRQRRSRFEEAREAFDIIMSGEATPGQIGGFLMALRVRGETVDEISGAVATMRDKMLRVEAPDGAIDIVGTGGDGSHSVQHLDRLGLRDRRRRRAGRQARQSRAVVADRRGRRADRARRQDRP